MSSREALLQHILQKFEDSHEIKKEVAFKKKGKGLRKVSKGLKKEPSEVNVGIIGGGIAGLFSALLLKQLGIRCTILEKENRLGGRIFTKRFKRKLDEDEQWQFAELGAMRVPADHRYFFNLIGYLNANVDNCDINTIPYHYSHPNNLYLFNGTRDKDGNVMTKELFDQHQGDLGFPKIIRCYTQEEMEQPSPDSIKLWLRKDLDKIDPNATVTIQRSARWKNVSTLYESIFEKLDADYTEFGEVEFINRYDRWTTFEWFDHQIRGWLVEDTHTMPEELTITSLVNSVRHYAELVDSATGLNHLALVEAVIDRKNFNGSEWKTIQGGMQILIDRMEDYLKKEGSSCEIKRKASVHKICRKDGKVLVHWMENGEKKDPLQFDRVIVTAPFGTVRFWEMPHFSYLKRQAIRSLNYDHSTKIFLRTQKRFWEEGSKKIVGGSSKTDLPVRTVVYPSYGVDSGEKGVILASYTWANDAIRWSLLTDPEIKNVCIDNLTALHGETIRDLFIDEEITIQKWYEAFALFAPRQLLDMLIPSMVPEEHIHFAGEHLSTCHAWIIGALYSAHRAVKEILYLEGISSTAIDRWNEDSEWHENGDARKKSPWTSWTEVLDNYHSKFD